MFLCPKCPKFFVDKKQLLDHQRYHVKLEVTCDICLKKLPSKDLLKFHIRDKHNTSSIFSCEECGKSYKHRTSLVAHQRLHNGSNKCPYCNKNFVKKEYLQSHIINCEPVICGDLQEFERDTEILIKMDLNDNDSSENDANDYVESEKSDSKNENILKSCTICNKEVLRLDKHMTTHNINVESCHICNKSFNNKRYLEQHKKTHESTKVQDRLNFFLLDNAHWKTCSI